MGFEIKLGITPRDTRATEIAMADLGLKRCYQVNASKELFPLKRGLWVGGLAQVIEACGWTREARGR